MQLADIALRNLWRRKSKMFFLLLGITIGVATIVTLCAITSSMNREVSNKFDQIGSNMVILPKSDTLTLSYGGITVTDGVNKTAELSQDVIEKILSIENSENIAAIAPKLLGTLETDAGRVLAVGVDFATEMGIKTWWKIQGEKPLEQNQVVLGSSAAKVLNKEVGSTITVNNRKLIVAGILKEIGSEEDNALFINLELLQNILDKKGKLSFIEVSALCYTCPIEDITTQISNKLPEAKVTAVLEAVQTRKAIVDRFSTLARTVSLIILFIGTLIVANSVMSSVNQRIREIGIFRAIGFRKKHVVTIIFLETIFVSSIGGIIGFLIGNVLAKWLAPLIAQMEVPIVWDFKLGLAAVALAVLVGIVASIFPTFKAIRQHPAHSLRFI